MFKRLPLLKIIYITLISVLILLIVFTPYLIKEGISVLEEEMVEGFVIVILLFVGYWVIYWYRRELQRQEHAARFEKKEKQQLQNQLTDAFKYIGALNIWINTIKSVFEEQADYPRNKQEMKQAMKFLATKTLSFLSTDWVMLRVINTQNQNTLREYIETRGSVGIIKHEISNKELVNGHQLPDCQAMSTSQNSFNIKTFCVFPKTKVNREQTVMIQTVLNQLEMIYLIFDSRFYKYRDASEASSEDYELGDSIGKNYQLEE